MNMGEILYKVVNITFLRLKIGFGIAFSDGLGKI